MSAFKVLLTLAVLMAGVWINQTFAAEGVGDKPGTPKTGGEASALMAYSGTLVALTKEETDALGDPTVIAKLEMGEDKPWVRAFNEDLKVRLVDMIGQDCNVRGKLSGDEKYVQIQHIILAGPANASRTARGHL